MSLQVAEYEYAVLALALTGDAATQEQICSRLSKNDFHAWANQEIFQAIHTLRAAGEPADLITVTNWLRQRKKFTEELNTEYVTELAGAFGLRCNLDTYVKELREKRLARVLYEANERIEDGGNPWIIAEEIHKLTEEPEAAAPAPEQQGVKTYTLGEIASYEAASIRRHSEEQPGTIKGVPYGFADLDDITLGLMPDELGILAARPGEGKTAFAWNVAWNVAKEYGLPVDFYCLEMSRLALIRRLFATETGITTQAMRTGLVGADWLDFLDSAAAKMANVPIRVIDQSGGVKVVSDIRRTIETVEQIGDSVCDAKHKPRLIIVDHIAHLEAESEVTGTLEVTTEVSMRLKRLARDLHIPVLALSQLNRPDKTLKKPKRYMLGDLRSSGAIEQDADQVIFIFRPAYHEPHNEEVCKDEAYILVRKNREGKSDKDIYCRFDSERSQFISENGRTKYQLYDFERDKNREPPGQPIAQQEPQLEPILVNLETEVEKPMPFERETFSSGRIAYIDRENNITLEVRSLDACIKSVERAALADGSMEGPGVKKLFADAYCWAADQTGDPMREAHAAECCENLSQAFEEVYLNFSYKALGIERPSEERLEAARVQVAAAMVAPVEFDLSVFG